MEGGQNMGMPSMETYRFLSLPGFYQQCSVVSVIPSVSWQVGCNGGCRS